MCVLQEAGKSLGLALWMQAFDRYALAAQVTGQLSFLGAMKHKGIVTEVANSAGAEGRTRMLGVMYDALARCAVKRFILGVVFALTKGVFGTTFRLRWVRALTSRRMRGSILTK